MAYHVEMPKEVKEKAVKTQVQQVNLDGNKVETEKHKICPLLASPCIKNGCKWFVDEMGICAIQMLTNDLRALRKGDAVD